MYCYNGLVLATSVARYLLWRGLFILSTGLLAAFVPCVVRLQYHKQLAAAAQSATGRDMSQSEGGNPVKQAPTFPLGSLGIPLFSAPGLRQLIQLFDDLVQYMADRVNGTLLTFLIGVPLAARYGFAVVLARFTQARSSTSE